MACLRKRRERWVIDFYDTRGKRRWKTLPKGTTKGKARDAIREIEDQLARGVYLPEKRIPLFKDVATDWLEQKKLNVRASTWEMYRGHVEKHFEDVNDIRVNRLATSKVEKFIVAKQTAGMNITTLRKIIVTFNQIMQYTVRNKYLDHNPVRDAQRPKDRGKIKESHIKVLDPEQINSFFGAVENPKYKTLFMLAILSGARQGELLGLKWTDTDWINNQIHIQRSFNTHTWYKPKTKASYRRIDLGSTMMKQLKAWRLTCPPNDLDLIFPSEKGSPLEANNVVTRYFRKAMKKAGLPRLRFHDLRHTYASLLIEQGENIKYIQSQLGHSSPTVTLNVYAHLMKPVNQASANRLENTIFEATGSKMVAETKKGLTAVAVSP
ncbi:MAG: site-specific integrase [Desulfosarcina sp.]|nr:site-specific integrase [Desulfosarcina sp.]MBC2742608.1 site-specific integrase [Desulfosarcina sp.]MBC2765518.1 site-specific integrase [Desulfosarcina sp.]